MNAMVEEQLGPRAWRYLAAWLGIIGLAVARWTGWLLPGWEIGLADFMLLSASAVVPLTYLAKAPARGRFQLTADGITRIRGAAVEDHAHHELVALTHRLGMARASYSDGRVLTLNPAACPECVSLLASLHVVATNEVRPGRLQHMPLDRLRFPPATDVCSACAGRPATRTSPFRASRGVNLVLWRFAQEHCVQVPACRRCRTRMRVLSWITPAVLLAGIVTPLLLGTAGVLQPPWIAIASGAALVGFVGYSYWGDAVLHLVIYGAAPLWLSADHVRAWVWFASRARGRAVAEATVDPVDDG